MLQDVLFFFRSTGSVIGYPYHLLLTIYLTLLATPTTLTGVVHAWLGQKLLKSNVLRVLFIVPKLQLVAYFT